MERAYREYPVPPRLRAYLACGWTSRVDAAGLAGPLRILPDACIDIVWMPHGIQVVGPDTRARTTWAAPGDTFAGVRFRPGAATPILGLPATELLDLQVELAQVWGSAAERQLANQAGDQPLEQLAALTRVLDARLTDVARPDPLVQDLVQRLRNPASTLDGIADALGLSHRQLLRRCEEAVGYGPKMLQRVLRFQHSLALARRPDARLVDVAHAAGFADQAHFTREVHALAGVSPRTLAVVTGA